MDTAKAVIVCAAGPSLLQVPYREPGYPLAVISTAIRVIPEPDYWLLVDRVKTEHGDEGMAAAKNPKVKKVVPGDREGVFRKFPNVETVKRFHPGAQTGREFMDGRPGVVTGCNRSMLFAVQWLAFHFDTLIFAGVDLSAPRGQPYAHDFQPPEKKRAVSMKKGLQMERDQLRQWAPIAAQRGVRWLSWSPGSPIEKFMESYKWKSTRSSENSGA